MFQGSRCRAHRRGALVSFAGTVPSPHRLLVTLLAVALLVAPVRQAQAQDTVAVATSSRLPTVIDTIFGRSGRLLARFLAPRHSMELEPISRLFGKREQKDAETVAVTDSASGRMMSLIAMRPFAEKVNGRVGDYHSSTLQARNFSATCATMGRHGPYSRAKRSS